MSVNEDIDVLWDEMIATGAIVETGEDEYVLDLQVLQQFYPDLYQAHMDEIAGDLDEMEQIGLVQRLDRDGEDVYSLTPKGQRVADGILAAINQT